MPIHFVEDGNKNPHSALRPDDANAEKVAIGASSTAMAAACTSEIVYVCATVNCWISVAAAPTATNSDMYLPANTPLHLKVVKDTDKIAVIQDSVAGSLSVVPMA